MAVVVKATPLTFVVHALAVACAVMVLVWCIHFRGGLAWETTNKSLIFNIHPVLMLIGFIILGGEAIVSYKSLPFKKEVKKVIHLVLHAVALILGIVGIWAAFKFHNESSILNLYSLHSWLGIGIIVLYGLQWVYGFVTFFYPGGSSSLRADSLPWHVLFGIFVYSLAIANAAIGFLEKLTFLESAGLDKVGAEAYLVNFTAIATVLFGAFVLFTVYAQKDQEPEEEYSSYSAI
ncbi:transmembrane ascorbate ferrireductase 1-like [Chenopodium quinoa]|uniref:ascorbate ferrireductase (transmembrane) n=1 Tax=Chenopodium quinoa TaxID=63459 RepID=A0A803M0E4_CHEQI|nr:transmembrane ascorbate ferrireductase 1-like [Chenopodium quinoa]